MDTPSRLRMYCSDRRKLMEYLLSSGHIREVKTASGTITSYSTIDFDTISSDYVLDCIRSGGIFDVSHGTKRHLNESFLPIMSGDAFYLHTDPESTGSPPRHAPPPMPLTRGPFESSDWMMSDSKASGSSTMSNGRMDLNNTEKATGLNSLNGDHIPPLKLPSLKTGLLDDELRESAYEVLLSCILFSRPEMQAVESKKKEKSSKFLFVLTSRRGKRRVESESPEGRLNLLHTIRTQMQISESVEAIITKRVVQLVSENSFKDIDVPQLLVALLNGILRSDFPSEKHYFHWRNRQANVLEEMLSSDHLKIEKNILCSALAKIRNSQDWDFKMSAPEKNDVFGTISEVVLTFSSIPGRFGMDGETCYWTSCYHLNIRLYEKLLLGLFDILEDGQLIEEADEVLKLLKLTWPLLGITGRLHHVLFTWVFFQQFITTKKEELLDYAILEVEKALSSDVCDGKEVSYIRSLVCFGAGNGNERRSNVVQSIFWSIGSWCDSKLREYHLQFGQKSSFFESVLKMALYTGTRVLASEGNIQFARSCLPNTAPDEKIRIYVEKSLAAVCRRLMGPVGNGSVMHDFRHLADIACQLRLIAEKDLVLFSPFLQHWYPDSARVTAKTLHQFYGERLEPFLKDISSLSDDVREFLPAAYALECCLIELYSLSCAENKSHADSELNYYPIAEVSRPIILDWVVAQQGRILEWTGRAFDLEDWDPLSLQQKQAASAIEVFRIIEETVDQFFGWGLPMDIIHLQALLSVVFHCLDAYLSKVINQLVERHILYPPTPPLTRYKEAMFPLAYKNAEDTMYNKQLDDTIYRQLDDLTVPKLCIRLNTYQYIQKQIALLEDSIRKSWQLVTSNKMLRCSKEKLSDASDSVDLDDESVSELFVATLDCITSSASTAIKRTSEFLGARIVFWDLRDSFLLHLYHDCVERNRFDNVLPQFDSILNTVCGLIDDTIRDLVVHNILKASLEGFMWVLLDGGPTRAFSDSDIPLLEEDFNILMDLFIADGEGLPRCIVEEEAKSHRQILHLFSLQTESLIRMLLDSSSSSSKVCVDSQALLRVLCHKKDKEASEFLKNNYKLPPSSSENFSSPPVVADMIRSASLRWSERGQMSFRSLRKKLQETTGI